jgi:putative ABC transport system permease protein
MQIRPILTSLRKHRIPALLIVLEIALACAVLCNAVFMISRCAIDTYATNAIDEAGMTVIHIAGIEESQASDAIARDLAALRAIGGVQSVAAVSAVPLDGDAWLDDLSNTPGKTDRINTSEYFMGEGAERTVGLRLLQGRYFTAEDYAGAVVKPNGSPSASVVLINESDASRWWPRQSALGKRIYSGTASWIVVGVVADVLAQDPNFSGGAGRYSSIFFPLNPGSELNRYVIRSTPADRDRILRQAMDALGKLEPNAVLDGKIYADMRADYFAASRNLAWMLALVCVVMLAVTALGIVGLTSFWVGQRRRQIGIRRAVGASYGHILRYFQTENFLLSTAGVLLGTVLAYVVNIYLMHRYEVDRMPWWYLGCGAAALWLLGQLAVLGPALRAAAVPPVVATRSV